MADVEVVATYELYNINRTKLENLIHRVFDPARLDIEIKDRFGNPVVPREWFLVPLFVIDEAVEQIKDGTITDYTYDPKTAPCCAPAELVLFVRKRLRGWRAWRKALMRRRIRLRSQPHHRQPRTPRPP